jgi:multidrug resistance efflux pump
LSLPVSSPTNPESQTTFRREALDSYLEEAEGKGILQVSPLWTRVVTVTLGCLIMAAIVFAIFGKVEVTERGRGILKPLGGVRLLNAPGPGVVGAVLARTGDHVRAGDAILRLDSPQLQGALLEADQALQARAQGFAEVARSKDLHFQQQIRTQEERILQLTQEVTSYRRVGERTLQRLGANQELFRLGIIGKHDLQQHEDQLDNAQRAIAASEQALKNARQEMVGIQSQRQHEVWSQTTEEAQARARRQSLELSLRESLITAPVDGIVDGVVLRPGDQVPMGMLAAKVIPVGTPLLAIAFLAEKDRAFVREGDVVALELAQYPHSEFGTLRGRVDRVGTDLAGSTELTEAFGSAAAPGEGASFRVEIRLEPQDGKQERITLRPGALLNARFTLRRQRLITLVIEPLKRWLK